jgi:hypothetical protein
MPPYRYFRSRLNESLKLSSSTHRLGSDGSISYSVGQSWFAAGPECAYRCANDLLAALARRAVVEAKQ